MKPWPLGTILAGDQCHARPPAQYIQQLCLVRKDHVENGHPHQNYGGLAWFDDGVLACRRCYRERAVVGGMCGGCDEAILDHLANHFEVSRVPKCPVRYQQGYKCDQPVPCPVHSNPILFGATNGT